MDWDYVEKEKARIQGSNPDNIPVPIQVPVTVPIQMPVPTIPTKQSIPRPKKPRPKKQKQQNPFTPARSPSSTVSAPYRASPELPNHKGFHLTIDVRESTIFSICKDIYQIQDLTDAFCPRLSTKSLLLGDMELQNAQRNTVMMFERKTISDLLASIKDGRYREQSYRLNNACSLSSHNIVYIIEGPITSKYSASTVKQIRSALLSLQFFKGFSVIRTNSARETAEYIMDTASRLASKLAEGRTLHFPNKESTGQNRQAVNRQPENGQTENGQINGGQIDGEQIENRQDNEIPSYSTVVKSCKKQNVTYQNIHAIMLSQIPGISPYVAELILEGNTLEHMIDRLRKGDRWLFSLKVAASANAKPRNMSKAIIQSIYLYFFNTPPPSAK